MGDAGELDSEVSSTFPPLDSAIDMFKSIHVGNSVTAPS